MLDANSGFKTVKTTTRTNTMNEKVSPLKTNITKILAVHRAEGRLIVKAEK